MGDDISSGLSSMAICFDFRSTNVVQLSNRNSYFYRFRCHHPLITQLNFIMKQKSFTCEQPYKRNNIFGIASFFETIMIYAINTSYQQYV